LRRLHPHLRDGPAPAGAAGRLRRDVGLSRESSDTLVAGNVVTVEPGIYLEGLGGIRIEDLVIVTDGEPEILTTTTKDLVEVS
jgi:Xaa-Pro aminopeptidase